MFNVEEIRELVRLVSEHKLAVLEVERPQGRLRIVGQGAGGAEPARDRTPPASAETSPPSAQEPVSDTHEPEAHVLTSPIVGTFYAAPSPDAEPYVRVGDRVQQGQVVCIVEAMKLMNEIEADVEGTVLRILPDNAQPVEYGEPLFAIEVG